MLSVQNVLFPVDFSRRCRAASPYIADLANRFRAKLNFLHVVESDEYRENPGRQRAGELAAFAAEIPGGMYLPQAVAYGEPAQKIVDYTESHQIDIIAMPAANTSGLGRALGSTTGRVLRQASAAVWTESATGHPHARWSPILCAVDLETGSKQVLSYAAALAETFQANLILVHIGGVPRKLETLVQGLDISAELVTEMGNVEEAVRLVAKRTAAELLVIGRGRDAGVRGSLGAHTYELVRSSVCPVVCCPRPLPSQVCFWTEWQQEDTMRGTRIH